MVAQVTEENNGNTFTPLSYNFKLQYSLPDQLLSHLLALPKSHEFSNFSLMLLPYQALYHPNQHKISY